MKFKLTNNEKLLEVLREGFKKKGGYCPCKVEEIDENICPCDEFIDTGECHCGLFEIVE